MTTLPIVAAATDPAQVSLIWALPFALLLASIALMPFIHRHWWERHYPKVAIGLALVAPSYYWFVARAPGPWLESMEEYVGFIVLLGSLYVVSGGILITVGRKATPLANCTLLLIGAIAANVFGTTGASMLLIRPYLRMNRGHIKPYHVVFFIFLVSNVGGALTPIGDPPLFLGYLHGVPFWWVLENCRLLWGLAVAVLLATFWVIDTRDHGRFERNHEDGAGPAVHLLGVHNFLFIALILYAVFRDGFFDVLHEIREHGVSGPLIVRLALSREILMIAAVIGSRRLTGREIYHRNEFTLGPIKEVAILFIGIFSTMVPALQYLRGQAPALQRRGALTTPGQFYFTSGALSSVLDNAPTYLTFLEMKLGTVTAEYANDVGAAEAALARIAERGTLQVEPELSPRARAAVAAVIRYHGRDVLEENVTREEIEVAFLLSDRRLSLFLIAISMGSVFFGACTYIGNGPNFMVKSIADSVGAPTPGFLAYVTHYALPFLLPAYVLVWALFLR